VHIGKLWLQFLYLKGRAWEVEALPFSWRTFYLRVCLPSSLSSHSSSGCWGSALSVLLLPILPVRSSSTGVVLVSAGKSRHVASVPQLLVLLSWLADGDLHQMSGTLQMLMNIFRVGVRRMGPDSFQWCPATGQGAAGTN